MNRHTGFVFRLTAAAIAVLAAVGAYAAEDDEITALTKPESNIEFGLGYVNKDGLRFGQYSGLNEKGSYGLLGGSLIKRDDATGTWLNLSGRNLGLESRELRFEHNRQGNWGYFIEYGVTPRFNPYTVNTGLSGIGTATQTINGTALRNVELKTEREAVTLGFSKNLPAGWDFQVRFKNEEKDGARQWGQGGTFPTTPSTALVNFLVDPINQTTRQVDVILGYAGEKLQLSGGYYGTLFENHNTVLNVPNSTVFTQMALPPGNQSHQFHLASGYSFTPTTRGTFKLAYTRATQNESFFVAPTMNTRTDLGGAVDTTLLQMGIVARPMPKLSLRANLRYEDRDDNTPLALYTTVIGTSTLDGFNEPRSIRTLAGKLEASYALPMSLRLTGGVDYDEKKRNTFRVASVSQREQTDETSYRVELRRSMSETLTGALAYIHSDRDGSPFLTTVRNDNITLGSNLIAPIHLADRKRDKVRLSADWQATEQLSLQFRVDESRDNYGQRAVSILGAQKGEASAYSVDAAYAFSDEWQATAWISRDDTRFEQLTRPADPWQAKLRNVSDSFGLGVRGKPLSRLEIGADLSHANMRDENRQQALSGTATDVVPDISTKLTKLNLFTKYAVKKNVDLRLNYIYDRFSTDDWTWTRWTYSDDTQVLQSPTQTVHFVGVSMNYRF